MASSSTARDYKAEGSAPKTQPAQGQAAVEEFLQLLARAVRQFHTYPPASSMCTDAVAACHKAFAALDRRDRLVLRVTPTEFLDDERPLGAGTIIAQELVRRLHKAHVAAIEFDAAVSPRDLSRFCTDVLRSEDLAQTKTTFAELLAEHGVELIVPRMAHRPEVLDVGPRPEPIWDLVKRDRARRETAAAAGPVQYLYPPEKGWVRLDSASDADAISLVDLAVLVDDPADVATMLLRLTDDDPVDDEARKRALEQKFGDVAMLFAALDGHLARVMFGKLARAVLTIAPERRKTLLQRTILPGLLDGRASGAVLRDFPDHDLAESLCLLLELETAAPEVVTAALQRLDLPAERRETIAALVDERLRSPLDAAGGDAESRDHKIDRFARKLIRVDATQKKDFREFAAFDLSVDDHVIATLAEVGPTIAATDVIVEQIDCLWRLTRLEPNPTLVDAFMRRASLLLNQLDRAARTDEVCVVGRRYRDLAEGLRESRPDVSDAIVASLSAFCTQDRVLRLLGFKPKSDRPELATTTIEAFGDALVPSFVAILDSTTDHDDSRALAGLLTAHADRFAAALAARLGTCGRAATRIIVRTCGYAGIGYETIVADQLTNSDEQTVREAIRALARIGSPRAAALVTHQIQAGSPLTRAAAEEALWHLPPAQTAAQLRDILTRREFVVANPVVVSRLIERAAQSGAGGLDAVLEELEGLRFRFWNPGLVRVALKARELRDR
jgi:signal transduction histidine kinase